MNKNKMTMTFNCPFFHYILYMKCRRWYVMLLC
jgi:hypothetical protein